MKITKLVNPRNNEVWNCKDLNDTMKIDGVDYIKVFKGTDFNQARLMRKESLNKLPS